MTGATASAIARSWWGEPGFARRLLVAEFVPMPDGEGTARVEVGFWTDEENGCAERFVGRSFADAFHRADPAKWRARPR